MKALLSIKPAYVEEIISGEKKYEYRKRIFKKEIESVIVYACMPVGKIIGEFKIGEVINKKPAIVWEETKDFSGVTQEFFNQYFEGKEEAYAIYIKDFYTYDEPINPYEKYENFVAPQSFMYID